MGWIEASLRFAGRFASGEKAAYMDRFGVSPAQMSHDQRQFAQHFNQRCGAILVEVAKGKLSVLEDATLPPEPIFESDGSCRSRSVRASNLWASGDRALSGISDWTEPDTVKFDSVRR